MHNEEPKQSPDDSRIHWEHTHDFEVRSKKNESKVKLVFYITFVVMVIEITAGTLTGSMALLADGWHMGTHAAAFLITLFTYYYASKHSSNRTFSFGTGKVNYLGSFASAIALGMVAILMAVESIERLFHSQAIHFEEAIFVAILGLFVNTLSVFILHEKHVHSHGHNNDSHNHGQDHNLKAAYFHILADTLTSVLAIIALLAGKYFGWIWMDALMGIVGAFIIAKWSFNLVKESSTVLLDKTVDFAPYDEIAKAVYPLGQSTVQDIHIWKIGSTQRAAIVSISALEPATALEYKNIIRNIHPELSHITVEVVPAKVS